MFLDAVIPMSFFQESTTSFYPTQHFPFGVF